MMHSPINIKYMFSISVEIPCLFTFLVTLFLLELAVNPFTVRCLSIHGHAHTAENFVPSSTELLEEHVVSILGTDGEAKMEPVPPSGKYIISQKTTRR